MIGAIFYDGQTSRGTPVRLYLEAPGTIRITGLERELTYQLSQVRIARRLGNTTRRLYLPGGAMCETSENDAIDAILKRMGRSRLQTLVYTLENKWTYVLAALFATLAGGWLLIGYGIPMVAKRIAYAVPTSVDATMGRDGLDLLDRTVFSPSALDNEQQETLQGIFDSMTQQLADGHVFRLEFRKSERIGPNALALPSGIIIVTDELVLLARHQNELVGVLAHELGHVEHRHALRTLLQNSVAALFIASLTGDVTSVTALSAALPTLLVEAKYSRAFETEADRFALQYLRAHSISPTYFADILVRMDQASNHQRQIQDYLASHPVTSERIRMLREDTEPLT